MDEKMDDQTKAEATEISVKGIFHKIPRGKPKSGRTWKTVRTERYSQGVKSKQLKSSWTEKMSMKNEKKKIKEFQEQLKGDKVKRKQQHRLNTEAKKQQKLLNQRRSEITQPIKSSKVKKLKKKLLRTIETR